MGANGHNLTIEPAAGKVSLARRLGAYSSASPILDTLNNFAVGLGGCVVPLRDLIKEFISFRNFRPIFLFESHVKVMQCFVISGVFVQIFRRVAH